MIVYAETSAVLAWLLGEREGETIRATLASADVVFASDLTVLECRRVMSRATAAGSVDESEAADLRARLAAASVHWVLLALTEPVQERASRPFPAEPIRTLDALHVSSALEARSAIPDVVMLSLDESVRGNATLLGFALLPTQ